MMKPTIYAKCLHLYFEYHSPVFRRHPRPFNWRDFLASPGLVSTGGKNSRPSSVDHCRLPGCRGCRSILALCAREPTKTNFQHLHRSCPGNYAASARSTPTAGVDRIRKIGRSPGQGWNSRPAGDDTKSLGRMEVDDRSHSHVPTSGGLAGQHHLSRLSAQRGTVEDDSIGKERYRV